MCVCFQIKFSEFVARQIGEEEGVILEAETGDFLGKHRGFWFYTIGQRQGLRLPGGPWYTQLLESFLLPCASLVLLLPVLLIHCPVFNNVRVHILIRIIVLLDSPKLIGYYIQVCCGKRCGK